MITREQWLNSATDELRTLFKQHGYEIPANVKATCGFPSRAATARSDRRIGECWDAGASDGKVFEMFISPVLAEPVEVLAVLAHELVHATVGLEHGHKAPFKRCAVAIGLEGKMTATHAGEAFKRFAADALAAIGEYPHAALNPSSQQRKQTTRLIKCECAECGYTVRTTRQWLEQGAPICPQDNEQMEVR